MAQLSEDSGKIREIQHDNTDLIVRTGVAVMATLISVPMPEPVVAVEPVVRCVILAMMTLLTLYQDQRSEEVSNEEEYQEASGEDYQDYQDYY